MDHPRIKLTRDSVTQIAQLLAGEEDEQLKLDTLEGETDLFELVSLLLDTIDEIEGMISMLDLHIDERKLRKERMKVRVQQLKDTILSLMDSAAIKKVPLPQATVFISQRPGGWKLVVDPAELEDKFRNDETKTIARPNKEAIDEAVGQGILPKGILRTNGGPALNVRRK